MKLSFIVPVYNVKDYLQKCVDSLVSQDYDDYEIILVDDGSTDGSGLLADTIAESINNSSLKIHHPFVSVIHQDNKGLSGARNSGIQAAKGEYIQFVDADDFLEPNVEKSLIEKMDRENLDILRFNYQNVNERYEIFEPNKSGKPFVDYTDEICDGITFLTERLGFACYVVQFVFRTDLVKSIAPFRNGVYFEDTEWTPRALIVAERVTSVDTMIYNYLVREGSITKGKTIEKKRKIVEDKMLLIDSLTQQMSKVSDRRWYQGMISSTVISIFGCVVEDFYSERNAYIRRLRQANVFPLSDYHLNKLALRKRLLINFSPSLFCCLYKLKNG